MAFTLERLKNFHGRKGPLLLIIMDGMGLGKNADNNAIYLAKTPVLDKLMTIPLKTQLKAHGPAVGMPSEDDMGNSEVGHNALGAGRVFAQGAALVNLAIENGAIFKSKTWKKILEIGKSGHTVHLIGLLSDGNVHSHIRHLFALIHNLEDEGVSRVRVHALLDGRDVGEKSALTYVYPTEELLRKISEEKGYDYKIASGGGRMNVTMDRYNADWSIVKRGWEAHVHGEGRKFPSATEAVTAFYNEDPKMTDQYMDSFVVVDENEKPVGTIEDGDAVVFFNFRGDRAIEISRAFQDKNLETFDRGRIPDVFYAGMMEYDGDLHIPSNFLVSPPEIECTISEYLCAEKVTSFAISETQKFGHVTYFWNGNRSGYINESLEKYFEIPSDRITFDKAPQMKANEITAEAKKLLRTGEYKFGRLNFANGDMVGHTGDMQAAITAVETVDKCVGELLTVIEELHGIALITADHGNAEEMFTVKNGVKTPKTSHTLNPVPFIIFDPEYQGEYKMAEVKNPGLSNVASTILNLLGFRKVEEYDESLISVD
ncbi:MAG TPA: 2,3-bisphosphoglycerate-independent phosphoglycerate mutase [Ignavibacteriales bacterium]|nr:2,3-bisphosphoglycerate-independent phosphoglycerate mutase [Ignavibacteriales bacterium]